MKLIFVFGLAVFGKVIQKIRTHTEEEYWASWKEFLSMDEVQERTMGYQNQLEHDQRFEIFKDGMEKIKAHNAENRPWRMAVTQFADMTSAQFKEHTSCIMERGPAPTEVFTAPDDWSVPDSVDWAASGQVTAVKNQGGCGSCWAFSTTGAIESRASIAGKGLTSLSEQDLVDCSKANSGCNGGLMDYAFAFVMTNGGLCSEDDYAYTGVTGTSCLDGDCTKYDAITTYTDVAQTTAALEAAVAAGPVSIAIEADQTSFQYYSSGVLTGDCGTSLDHGVLVVGYGTDSGADYWKVKNSWGANWGESGYIRLCRNCDKNDGAGQCGLLEAASYPVV